MYHAIIRRKLRSGRSRGDFDPTVVGMAKPFEHRFAGQHCLGGVRHTPEMLRAWFERLMRLTNHLDFEIHHIAVSGWPWDTTAIANGPTAPNWPTVVPTRTAMFMSSAFVGSRRPAFMPTSTHPSGTLRVHAWPPRASPRQPPRR